MKTDVNPPSQAQVARQLTPTEVGSLILSLEWEVQRMHQSLRKAKGAALRTAPELANAMAQAVHLASRLERGMGEVRKDLQTLLNALDLVLLFGGKARVSRDALVSALSAKTMALRLCEYIAYRLSIL